MEIISLNLFTAQARNESLSGREYLVAPVSMLVPGVLSGSQGPLFYPKSEVTKNPRAWNYMPLTLGHPTDNAGNGVSARSPSVLEAYDLGFVFNVTTTKGKLDGEAWFDIDKVTELAPEILNRLQNNDPIELSTGLFIGNKTAMNGFYNGKKYSAVARGYQPDHLAVLIDKKGACSLEDGCGVLVNEEEEEYEELDGVFYEDLPDEAVLDELFLNDDGVPSAFLEHEDNFLLVSFDEVEEIDQNASSLSKGSHTSSSGKKKCDGKCEKCDCTKCKDHQKKLAENASQCGAGSSGKIGFKNKNSCNGINPIRKAKMSKAKKSKAKRAKLKKSKTTKAKPKKKKKSTPKSSKKKPTTKKKPKKKPTSKGGGSSDHKVGKDGRVRDGKGKFVGGQGGKGGKGKKPTKKQTFKSQSSLKDALLKVKDSASSVAVKNENTTNVRCKSF